MTVQQYEQNIKDKIAEKEERLKQVAERLELAQLRAKREAAARLERESKAREDAVKKSKIKKSQGGTGYKDAECGEYEEYDAGFGGCGGGCGGD